MTEYFTWIVNLEGNDNFLYEIELVRGLSFGLLSHLIIIQALKTLI
jgi:hypothetical protein